MDQDKDNRKKPIVGEIWRSKKNVPAFVYEVDETTYKFKIVRYALPCGRYYAIKLNIFLDVCKYEEMDNTPMGRVLNGWKDGCKRYRKN